MKLSISKLAGTLLLSGAISSSVFCNNQKPNIIFIMVDDLGYGDLGCYGQKLIKTPVIDKMAKEGMKFTNFYAGAPVCAPSRCVLLTGKHTGHSYIRNNGNPPGRVQKPAKGLWKGQNPIPDGEVTIAERLKDAGYTTGAIGKWGLGFENSSGDPNKQGFDYFYGYLCQVHAHSHYPYFLWENGKKDWIKGNRRGMNGIHSQDKFDEKATEFIRKNHTKPFFLYYPIALPHTYIQANNRFVKMYDGKFPDIKIKRKANKLGNAGYAAMVSHLDNSVGKIFKLLKELNIDDNTIVMFTSDNGFSPYKKGYDFFNSSGNLRGIKRDLFEGGIKTPFIVRWPGKVKAGTTSNFQGAFWDILPTLCDFANVKPSKNIDGISFKREILKGKNKKHHDFLYWEFPNRTRKGQAAIIQGDWKLYISGLHSDKNKMMLFNLKNDPKESNDISSKHSKRVKKMLKLMKREHKHSTLFPFKGYDTFLDTL